MRAAVGGQDSFRSGMYREEIGAEEARDPARELPAQGGRHGEHHPSGWKPAQASPRENCQMVESTARENERLKRHSRTNQTR